MPFFQIPSYIIRSFQRLRCEKLLNVQSCFRIYNIMGFKTKKPSCHLSYCVSYCLYKSSHTSASHTNKSIWPNYRMPASNPQDTRGAKTLSTQRTIPPRGCVLLIITATSNNQVNGPQLVPRSDHQRTHVEPVQPKLKGGSEMM